MPGGMCGSPVHTIQPLMGVQGACPLCCLPLWGREGVTLAISTPLKKLGRDFCMPKKPMIFFIRYGEPEYQYATPLDNIF